MALKRYNGTAWVVIKAADIGAEPAFSKNTAFNRNFGNIVNTVCEGNDPRLSVYNLGTFESENALIQYVLTNQLSSGLYKIGIGTATGDSMLSLSERETYYDAFIFSPQGIANSVRITKAGEVIYYVSINLKDLVGQVYVDDQITSRQKAVIPCSTSTAVSTVAKVVTTPDGNAPDIGDFIAVTFTAGNTADSMTLNVAGSGAKPVRLAGGAPTGASGKGASYCVAGNKILFWYDGDVYWQQGSQDITDATFSTITQAEIDAGTSTSTRVVTPKLLVDNFVKRTEALQPYTNVADITAANAPTAALFCTEAQFTAFQTSNPTVANAVRLVFTA